ASLSGTAWPSSPTIDGLATRWAFESRIGVFVERETYPEQSRENDGQGHHGRPPPPPHALEQGGAPERVIQRATDGRHVLRTEAKHLQTDGRQNTAAHRTHKGRRH